MLLEGSVRRTDDRVRISLHLVDAVSHEQTWAEVFEADLDDVLETQESIARSVAAVLRVELSLDEVAWRSGTDDPDAYLTYMEARYHLDRRSPDGLERARKLYEEAIDRDPVFAEAWEEAELRFRRAIELRPGYAPAHYWLSELLAHRGRTDEAIELARRAQELDPLSRLARADEGRALYQARRYDEAIEVFEATLADGPNFVAYLYEGLSHLGAGDLTEAVATLEAGREAYPHIPTSTALLAHAYGRAGREAGARKLFRELIDRREAGAPVAVFALAAVQLGLGRTDEALTLLERSIEQRDWQVVFLENDPLFDPLRSDPRFNAVLERVRPLQPARG